VRLLLDQNLSPRLLTALDDLFPGSTHVREVGLQAADDDSVWRYAAARRFTLSRETNSTAVYSTAWGPRRVRGLMPTLLRVEGFRFFLFSNEGQEPPHVHVSKGDGVAKLWLAPLQLAYARGSRRPSCGGCAS